MLEEQRAVRELVPRNFADRRIERHVEGLRLGHTMRNHREFFHPGVVIFFLYMHAVCARFEILRIETTAERARLADEFVIYVDLGAGTVRADVDAARTHELGAVMKPVPGSVEKQKRHCNDEHEQKGPEIQAPAGTREWLHC